VTGSVVTGNIGNSTSATAKSPGLVASTGGGIFNARTPTLIDDLISGNTANTGSALDVIGGEVNAAGGGIFNRRDATLTLLKKLLSVEVDLPRESSVKSGSHDTNSCR